MAMPVGHACVGLACYQLARQIAPNLPKRLIPFFILLAGLPDLDCVPVWLWNINAEWVHRTLSHSALFAVVVGGLLAWGLGTLNWLKPYGKAWLIWIPLTIASHGIVDLLYTDLNPPPGVQYLWPVGQSFWYLPQPFLLSVGYYKALGMGNLHAWAIVLIKEALLFGVGLNSLIWWRTQSKACSQRSFQVN